jgi:multiple sugar transport system ATP-binding protein
MAFGLKLRHVKKPEIRDRVDEAAKILALFDLLQRKPGQLSGGQRQRVAMGRAIVRQPQAYLMDEPLSNLDAKLRVQMRAEISRLQDDLGVTTIYVTHDQVEAMTMGDRVAVMRRGELLQVAPPQELYDRPLDIFVGGFIGSPTMNMLEVELAHQDGGFLVKAGSQSLRLDEHVLSMYPALKGYEGRRVVLGIRPEDLEDAALGDAPDDLRLRGKVLLREALGSELVVHFEIDAPPVLTDDTKELLEETAAGTGTEPPTAESSKTSKLVGRFEPDSKVREGETIEASVDTRALHFFDPENGLAIYDEVESPETAAKAA